MKKIKTKSENSKLDLYNTYSEDNIEFVSRQDEEETLQSLRFYQQSRKSWYTSDIDNYFD